MMTSRTTTALASKAPSASKGPRFSKRPSLTRLALALSTALTPVWGIADTLPTGGSVVHGAATIGAPVAGAMTIDQASDRAVVNWNDFSIGAGNRVTINQPSADAAILNRVTGDTTSQIHGQLNANGRVFVVNPNGIFIGATGAVNTGSFVASTLGIRTDDFVIGDLAFDGDGSSATVQNEGNIQVVTGGYAALIGGQVRNSGTIQAPMGFVGLGSGERITLDLGGDGFMQVAIPTDTDDPALKALIENSGTIQANGGTVQLSAATARSAARHAINMSGVIEARTVSGRNGRITLGGGGGGTVSVSGKVRTKATRPTIQVTQSARPKLPPARGGDITITGQNIALAGAEIDASGTNGGGNIRIGGNQQGADGLPTAQTLNIDAGTVINADAIETGDGGRVIAWSDVQTDFAGNISVRGGALGGDGGFAEVSGKQTLSYTGFTDARAPNGDTGTLLLDPTDIEIVAAAPGANQILNTDIETALVGANIVVSTGAVGDFTFPEANEAGTISIDAPISWTSGNTLRFNADQDIIVDAQLTTGDFGGLVLNAFNDVTVNANIDATRGDLTILARTDLDVAATSTISGQEAAILFDSLGNITFDGTLNAPSSNTDFRAGTNLNVNGTINARIASLRFIGTDIFLDGDITGDNSTYTVTASDDISMTGTITGEDAPTSFEAADAILLNGTISLPDGAFDNGELSINATGSSPITVGSGIVDVGQFQLIAGDWRQNTPTLSGFDADNFVLQSGSSFLRVTGGDGSTIPFEVVDVYGLQGVGTVSGQFVLAGPIDASPTSTWIALPGDEAPVTGLRDAGFVPFNLTGGAFEGQGNTISNLFIRRFNGTAASDLAGLIGTNSGIVRNITFENADVAGSTVGVVAAVNNGSIEGVSVNNSTVTVHVEDSSTSFGGGIVGTMGGSSNISDSRVVNLTLTDASDPSLVGANRAEDLFIGGIAGTSSGSIISRVQSSGSISYDNVEFAGRIGGIVGTNTGAITDAYSTASVSADTTSGDPGGTAADVGSISGSNSGTLDNVLANGPVSQTGPNPFGDVGAVTGFDDGSPTGIQASYFNPETTGQVLSGQNGEVDAGGLILFDGARSRTTAELNNAADFFENAFSAGWNFFGTWAIPQDGVDHARLFSVDPVIFARDATEGDPDFEYNGSTTGHTAPNAFYEGGPTVYLFGPQGDMGDLTVMDDQIILSDPNVGNVTFTFPTSYTSDGGQAFDVRSLPKDSTVSAAPLLITIQDTNKPYGDTLTFGGVAFTADTLFAGDTITSATVNSLGAPASAPASLDPYVLDLSAFVGTGLTNYNIQTVPGNLFVNGRALTVTIGNVAKVYGDALVLGNTGFSVSGLVDGDTLDTLDLSSAGAVATAPVAGNPYAINGTNPAGTGLENYVLNITPGTLTVTPRPASVSVPGVSKVYGQEIALDSTDFAVSGLVNGDTITSLTLSSDGTAATAPVAGSPYAINASDPVGTAADNYTLNVTTGTLVITPAPLTITADDQSKPGGTEFTFTGTEFTVTGLLNDDAVTSATLNSDAAALTAPLSPAPGEAILITDPQGTGLDNYTITLVNGLFVVAPGNLIITANDLSKVYGTELTFSGDEFTVAGLAEGDSVDSITLMSAGAAGTATVAPYSIIGSAAVGTGLEKYDLVFADGSLTVVAAPLTVTALDQTKQPGQAFTFAGTEFTTSGLLNGDSVDSAVLSSLGAGADALEDNSPFAITIGDLTGSGLDNYDIASVDGMLTIGNDVPAPIPNPIGGGASTIPNPRDFINIGLPGDSVFSPGAQNDQGSVQGSRGSGGVQQSLPQAQGTFTYVDTVSDDLELAIKSCGNADQDFTNYMACLSESLDTYANALDEIANDLPSGFETVSAVIQQARVGVDAAAARAERRLAGATSSAERRAIRRDALNEARGAINEAKTEIRKAISLIRADDPEVAAVQRQTGARIVQAFDTVDSELVRAIEL